MENHHFGSDICRGSATILVFPQYFSKYRRSDEPPLFHAHMAGPGHNDMIDQLDTENRTGFLQLGGDGDQDSA